MSCAVCADFDLCPDCFACGAEIGMNKILNKLQLNSRNKDQSVAHDVIS